MNIKHLLLLLVLGSFLFSCRTSKKIQAAMTKKDTTVTVVINPRENDSALLVHTAFQKIKANHIDFKTFNAKVKVDYTDSKQRNYDFNAFIRMRKDSIIWISINAALGIEAFRVLIRPDSIYIMDKLGKTIEYKSLAYLKEIAQLPIDFYTLQDLILGNPVYLDSSNVLSYKETEESVSLSTLGNYFKHLITARKSDFAILHSKLDDVDVIRNRTADFTYEDYAVLSGKLFSTNRKITIAEKTKLDVDMDFKSVDFDKDLTYNFVVPHNYKRK
ncbi:MAG: hypothetical protein C5B52_06875 [Bacteroidetes bacterium]|nr:MAG: hypothetical protein C5B52_06875 [Bacteroidota bacterium]